MKPFEQKTQHHPTTSSTLCRTPHLNNNQNKNTNPIISKQYYHFTQPCPSEEKQTNKQKTQHNHTLYTVHAVAKSQTRLSDFTFFSFFPFVQMRGPAQGVIGGWVMLGLVLQWFPLCDFSLFNNPQGQLSGSLGSWSQCFHSIVSGLDLWSGTKISQVVCYGIK